MIRLSPGGYVMTEKIKETAVKYRLNGIILILVGLFMLLWPEASLKILCIAVGVILIITGVVKLVHYYQTKPLNPEQKELILGIVFLVLGILLIVISRFFVSVFLILAGIALVIGCVLMFLKAWQTHKEKGPEFMLSLVIGILILVLGIVMIINPVGTAAFVIQICGVALMIMGLAAVFMKKESSF